MGESSEWIEANSGNCFGSCETHTKNLSRRQKENRGRCTCTLGEVQDGEEEGCLELWTREMIPPTYKPKKTLTQFAIVRLRQAFET
jgi:hypothetical protein